MLRAVQLPAGIPGRLLLHSMPGRYESLEKTWQQIGLKSISRIICLAELEEVRKKSPTYAEALENNSVPCTVTLFPIPDYGVSESRDDFWNLALEIAEQLRADTSVLIHCGAGIGRTGTLAMGVLLALGQTQTHAEQAVKAAGSGPERAEQRELVAWCAGEAAT